MNSCKHVRAHVCMHTHMINILALFLGLLCLEAQSQGDEEW